MKTLPHSRPAAPGQNKRQRLRWTLLIAGCALLVALCILHPWELEQRPPGPSSSAPAAFSKPSERFLPAARASIYSSAVPQPATAQEIVAHKVTEFGRSRRDLVRAIAQRTHQAIPAEIEQFFDALEAGEWAEIDRQWTALSKRSAQYEGSTHSPELDPFWCAVLDAYGVAEQAHDWPAQELLDYGNAILSSLRPGMVYIGGTDNGRWIPELLNETSDGERHVIITQNALADSRYLEFVTELYADRLNTISQQDSEKAFHEYVSDAQQRLEHDQRFPNDPKQIRPGEDVRMVDGKVQVSGQIAVMSINEKLIQALISKNPDLSFALQESAPLRGTYPDAVPLGPLMELRAQDGQTAFTSELAQQSVAYWRDLATQIAADPETTASTAALKSYSHDSVSAANLLASHHFTAEAEEAYRVAARIWPENPESVGGLADLLLATGREKEAQQLVEKFTLQYPNQQKDLDRLRSAWHVQGSIN